MLTFLSQKQLRCNICDDTRIHENDSKRQAASFRTVYDDINFVTYA